MKKKMFLGFALLITIVMPFNVNALVSEDITNAGAGETITVDGENTENLNLNKSVTLKGDKEDKIIGDLTISGNNIDVVLDGFTLEGHINITAQNSKITLKNMTLDGKNTVEDNILVTVRALNSDITVDNTTFKGFVKAGIYAETLKSIDVTNSDFMAFGTANIGSLEDYVASNPNAHEIVRSGACIDLNFGNQSGVNFNLDNVTIAGNHFEGVQKFAGEDSTAGAVKIKLKNASNVTLADDFAAIIAANEFVENTDDVVIGTSGQASTAEFLVAFYENTSSENSKGVRVTNNSSATKDKDVIDSTIVAVRNYSESSDTDQNVDFYVVTINDKEYIVNEGAALKEAVSIDDDKQINLDDFKVKEGYTFKNFVEKGTDNVVDENTVITKSMTIEAVFEKEGKVKDEVENPKTNDNIMFIITIAIASIALLTISLKKVLVK